MYQTICSLGYILEKAYDMKKKIDLIDDIFLAKVKASDAEQRNLIISYLNFIYFTSNTQKAHGTYIRDLEGADVGVMWSNVTE